MKTKPFNLEEAKAGAKVVTRDFRSARIICWDAQRNARHGNQPIVALVMSDDKQETPYAYYTDGSFMSVGGKSYADLFLVDETPESELTEFEQAVENVCLSMQGGGRIGNIHTLAEKLLSIARKELQKEQKSAEWSGKDIEKIRSEEYTKGFNDAAFGGKLKGWSEEDEDRIRQIERIAQAAGCTQKLQEEIHNWLKSLRPQPRWKPSDEQMEVYTYAFYFVAKHGFKDPNGVLESLYNDLKKL